MVIEPVEERIPKLRAQLKEITERTLAEINKEDQYPNNLHLIVQYASGVFQYADVLDKAEKKRKGIPI